MVYTARINDIYTICKQHALPQIMDHTAPDSIMFHRSYAPDGISTFIQKTTIPRNCMIKSKQNVIKMNLQLQFSEHIIPENE